MARLIDADKLKESWKKNIENEGATLALLSALFKSVEDAPTIDAVERKRGEWIEVAEDWRKQIVWSKCSECGYSVSTDYPYCPNCGARMKGEREGK